MVTLVRCATRGSGVLKPRSRDRSLISSFPFSLSSTTSSSTSSSTSLMWYHPINNHSKIYSCSYQEAQDIRRRPFSSWEYNPELPWSSAQTEKSKQQMFQRIERFRKEHQQKLDLQEALVILVKEYLETNYKEAFAIQSAGLFWKKTELATSLKSEDIDGKSTMQQRKKTKTAPTIAVHDALIELTKLNGFAPVPLPEDSIPLAEGIMVRPHYHKNESYHNRVRNSKRKAPLMWARSEPENGNQSPLPNSTSVMSSAQPRKDDLPELVEEDTKLYHIIENNVETSLNDLHRSLQSNVTMVGTKIQEAMSLLLPASFRHGATSKKPKKDDPKDAGTIDGPESLLFLDRNEIIWVTDMDHPRLRLLALTDHHSYGHNVASSLISISLVVFGAIPLAYRGYNFAYDYPGLSQTVAALVLLTISYGVWSKQSMAITRQSQVVSQAISHRIYARNNAVLWALQQGAVERVTDALLSLYFHCQNDSRQRIRLRPSSRSKKPLVAIMSGGQQETDIPTLPSTSVDAIALAKEIGLIREEAVGEENKDGNSSEVEKRCESTEKAKLIAVPIEHAISAVQKYRKNIQ